MVIQSILKIFYFQTEIKDFGIYKGQNNGMIISDLWYTS